MNTSLTGSQMLLGSVACLSSEPLTPRAPVRSPLSEAEDKVKKFEALCDQAEGVLHRLQIDGRGETPSPYYYFVEKAYEDLKRARETAGRPEPPLVVT